MTDDDLLLEYRDATDDYAEELERHHKRLGEISGRRYAAVVALADKGRTHQQIATMIGLNVGRVSHLVMRGRRRQSER
jgi:DNA-directed RNA polymerase specialized sigma24 family protein